MWRLVLLASITVAGCSLTASVSMKCKGECELTVEREVEAKPSLPIPKGN